MTAIYIHVPYCVSKCPYCDFASVPLEGSARPYLRALAAEARAVSEHVRSAETLYIGGGTPSILSAEEIGTLFEEIMGSFRIAPNAEVTFEANPCTLTGEKARALTEAGVNRVSLGAQSFVDAELSWLKRAHQVSDIGRAWSLLRDGGIENLSLDLIYAIPGQSVESWRYSLERAIELKPEHVSAYCLTFEPSTPLWDSLQKGKTEKKSDEEELALSETAHAMLAEAGYEHYEISNFALPGRRSKHNMVYWSNEEYLGLGASAVSYLGGKRITNLREPEAYIEAVESKGNAACDVEEISPRMQAIETIIQRLRLAEGIDCAAFTERFGRHPKEYFGDSLGELVDLNLVECTESAIRCTAGGWRLANEVALKLLG